MKITNIKELKENQFIYAIRDQRYVDGRTNTAVERYQGEVSIGNSDGRRNYLYLHNDGKPCYIYYNKNGDIDEPEYFVYTDKVERDFKILEILKIDLKEIIIHFWLKGIR